MDLAIELQKIYDSEINVEIGWLWDGGIEVRLGDKMSGYLAEESMTSTAEIIPWLQEAITHFFPTSAYASTLDSEFANVQPTGSSVPHELEQPLRAPIAVPATPHPASIS